MTEEKQAEYESEYEKLLALFIALLKNRKNDQMVESLYELSELRAKYLIMHALDGFGIDVEEAVQLLKSKGDDTLTQYDKDRTDRIVAAISNLIPFAVAAEYHLWLDTTEMLDDEDEDEDEEDEDEEIDFDSEDFEKLKSKCEKYNKKFAIVENEDVRYAMSLAAWWIGVGKNDYLMYMTQGDDRVRPWHAALEGFSARRDDFPSWMIPPIEWGCRCFLINVSGDVVENNADLHNVMAKTPVKPAQFNEIFSESVCKCGKIFGDAHPYFEIKQEHFEMLNGFVERLMEKWNAK